MTVTPVRIQRTPTISTSDSSSSSSTAHNLSTLKCHLNPNNHRPNRSLFLPLTFYLILLSHLPHPSSSSFISHQKYPSYEQRVASTENFVKRQSSTTINLRSSIPYHLHGTTFPFSKTRGPHRPSLLPLHDVLFNEVAIVLAPVLLLTGTIAMLNVKEVPDSSPPTSSDGYVRQRENEVEGDLESVVGKLDDSIRDGIKGNDVAHVAVHGNKAHVYSGTEGSNDLTVPTVKMIDIIDSTPHDQEHRGLLSNDINDFKEEEESFNTRDDFLFHEEEQGYVVSKDKEVEEAVYEESNDNLGPLKEENEESICKDESMEIEVTEEEVNVVDSITEHDVDSSGPYYRGPYLKEDEPVKEIIDEQFPETFKEEKEMPIPNEVSSEAVEDVIHAGAVKNDDEVLISEDRGEGHNDIMALKEGSEFPDHKGEKVLEQGGRRFETEIKTVVEAIAKVDQYNDEVGLDDEGIDFRAEIKTVGEAVAQWGSEETHTLDDTGISNASALCKTQVMGDDTGEPLSTLSFLQLTTKRFQEDEDSTSSTFPTTVGEAVAHWSGKETHMLDDTDITNTCRICGTPATGNGTDEPFQDDGDSMSSTFPTTIGEAVAQWEGKETDIVDDTDVSKACRICGNLVTGETTDKPLSTLSSLQLATKRFQEDEDIMSSIFPKGERYSEEMKDRFAYSMDNASSTSSATLLSTEGNSELAPHLQSTITLTKEEEKARQLIQQTRDDVEMARQYVEMKKNGTLAMKKESDWADLETEEGSDCANVFVSTRDKGMTRSTRTVEDGSFSRPVHVDGTNNIPSKKIKAASIKSRLGKLFSPFKSHNDLDDPKSLQHFMKQRPIPGTARSNFLSKKKMKNDVTQKTEEKNHIADVILSTGGKQFSFSFPTPETHAASMKSQVGRLFSSVREDSHFDHPTSLQFFLKKRSILLTAFGIVFGRRISLLLFGLCF